MAYDKNKYKKGANEDLTDINERYGRIPPQSIDLEEAVLGAILLESGTEIEVLDILKPESFYKDEHRIIFQVIQELSINHDPIDLLTVVDKLRKNKKLDYIGGAYFVSKLTQNVGSAAHLEYHSKIIAQKFIQRELIKISTQIHNKAYDLSIDVDDLLDFSEKELFNLAYGNIKNEAQPMNVILKEAVERIEEFGKRADGLSGVPSGFTSLDRITMGWQPSDLVIIAARPSMGKCLGKGTKVLMFSGELKNVEDIKTGELLMGDDSTPRKVLSTTNGVEKMYWVRQNKGIDYRVNESHILSLKRSRNEGKHKNGDVLNISISEYLDKSDKFKTNYKGYKVSVDFEENSLEIEPYFLGLWLGDGKKSDIRITTMDSEIVEYLESYAQKLDLTVTKSKDSEKCPMYAISGKLGGSHKLSLQNKLRELNLLYNKHIPSNYLINSTKNRLELLAGLIDSDGHYEKYCNGYEIVQKDKNLSEQIKFLCDSLGFRTSLIEKKATIKEIDYECDVYRLRFFGDIDRIQVKIKRKKAKPWTCNRTWNQTGVIVEYDNVDEYFGFEIDGNRLFLLEDMTVTHNTAFVLSMARNMAVNHKVPLAFFSLEMASVQLVNRLIISETELPGDKIKTGKLEDYEWIQLEEKIKNLDDAPIFLDDTPAITIFELRAKCRRLKMQHDIQFIIIDYLQLMSGTAEVRGNREQEVSQISRGLKALAKELKVPIIALSQLNRSVEMRSGDKRPQLSDLRESGAIEQDADIVIFIHRPEKYGMIEDEEGNSTEGLAEIIIAKHRNGAVTDVQLKFVAEMARFEEFDANGLSPISSDADGGNFDGGMTIGSKMNEDNKKKGGDPFARNTDFDNDNAPF